MVVLCILSLPKHIFQFKNSPSIRGTMSAPRPYVYRMVLRHDLRNYEGDDDMQKAVGFCTDQDPASGFYPERIPENESWFFSSAAAMKAMKADDTAVAVAQYIMPTTMGQTNSWSRHMDRAARRSRHDGLVPGACR